jgi:hypothetical protein
MHVFDSIRARGYDSDMKSKLVTIGIVLIILSLGALSFTYWNLNRASSASQNSNGGSQTLQDNHQKNLDWLSNIQGVENTTSTSATSTIMGDDLQTTSTQSAKTTTSIATTSTQIISVQNLGNADALQSTTYDLASNSLQLTAVRQNDHVVLSWTPTKSSNFASYLLLRSTTDPNPTPSTVNPIRTIADKSAGEYEDMSSQPGVTYYYRICFMKTSGNPGCGNILSVQLTN